MADKKNKQFTIAQPIGPTKHEALPIAPIELDIYEQPTTTYEKYQYAKGKRTVRKSMLDEWAPARLQFATASSRVHEQDIKNYQENVVKAKEAEEAEKARLARMIWITDRRPEFMKHPITGNDFNPNNDLFSAKYDPEVIRSIFKSARRIGVDPWESLAIGMQETKLGNSPILSADPKNYGLVGTRDVWKIASDYKIPIQDQTDLMNIYLKYVNENYRKEYDRLGIKYSPEEDSIRRLQYYNGLGVIGKYNDSARRDNDGNFVTDGPVYMYGIDVAQNPIDTKQNPVYGKWVNSIKESLYRDPDVQRIYGEVFGEYTDNYKSIPSIKMKDGGVFKVNINFDKHLEEQKPEIYFMDPSDGQYDTKFEEAYDEWNRLMNL